MDYRKHYNLLIERAKHRKLESPSEVHHILPKCLGGTDEPENLASLTPEEHYVAHQLLCKLYPNDTKLAYAAFMMGVGRQTNKTYGWIRKRYILACKTKTGDKNSAYGSFWITDGVANKRVYDGLIMDGWKRGRTIPSKSVKEKPIRYCVVCNECLGRNNRKVCNVHKHVNSTNSAAAASRRKATDAELTNALLSVNMDITSAMLLLGYPKHSAYTRMRMSKLKKNIGAKSIGADTTL